MCAYENHQEAWLESSTNPVRQRPCRLLFRITAVRKTRCPGAACQES